MTNIDNNQDIIDVRDIIARVEELDNSDPDSFSDQEAEEWTALSALLVDLKGNGGDEQWRGDWYPVTLIRDSYFKDYAMELAEELGYITGGEIWPFTCIDWDRASRELQMDYTSVDYDGVTYWYR